MSASRWPSRAFAVGDLGLASALGAGLVAIPERWWPVDVPGAALTLLLAAAGVALWRDRPGGGRWARGAMAGALAIGVTLVTALCLGGAFVAGVQGVFGRGAAVGYVVLVALAATWLVLFPAAQLAWLHGRGTAGSPNP